MILTGQLMLPGERTVEVSPGWLRLEGSKILEVVPGAVRRDADLGGENFLITPGFVDTHMHLPQIDAFGVYGMNLLEWLHTAIFPTESRWADPDHAELRCADALTQLWAVGTTSIFAFSSNHFESTRRALALCEKEGMRAIIGQPLSDRDVPEALCKPAGDCLEEARRLLELFPPLPENRVQAAVAPRFALSATPELLHGAGSLAREFGSAVATHLAETEPECLRAVELHGGPDYTSVYERAGLLSRRSVLGHCIHLSPSEQKLLADTGSVAAHCPTSNSFLRSGTMNRARWLREGIPVALASDFAAGYEKSMIRVARSMVENSFHVREAPPPAAEAWWQITQGNASLLGWDNTGLLAPGADADLVLVQTPHDWRKTIDPLGDLLWSWDDRWIAATFVNGNCRYRRAP